MEHRQSEGNDEPWLLPFDEHATPPGLDESFFRRQADVVARDLIGMLLLHDAGDHVLLARLVETEAYLDGRDLASHARFGRTRRNSAMFGPPGRAYVYFVYGMHTMLNVVTGPPGEPQAVLLRAAEPVAGELAPMNGPALLTRALGVRLDHNGADLVRGPLRIARGEPAGQIECGPRIGVAYAGPWAAAPLRFVDSASPALSRGGRPDRPTAATRQPEHPAGSGSKR